MSLQRRLLLIVLVGAPVVWLLALGIGLWSAQKEINELFDTEQVRLAQQVATLLKARPLAGEGGQQAPEPVPPGSASGVQADSGAQADFGQLGDAEPGDMSVAAWDAAGRLVFGGDDGPGLPYLAGAAGFVEVGGAEDRWRAYYQALPDGGGAVAVGQRMKERDELVQGLMLGQAAPWLLMLALLLPVLYIGVRRTMAPIVRLAHGIESRPSSDLRPLPATDLPSELRPLVEALNRLFGRIAESIEHDRRFTADAAHELRTPLAATRAQWEVASASSNPLQRAEASANVGQGLERMSQLVSQLLALSRLDSVRMASFEQKIDWRSLIGQTVPDVLALADQRAVEIGVQWQADAASVLPVVGNPQLVAAALRNLLDNAVRYGAEASQVAIVCGTDAVSVIDQGPGVPPELLSRLGDRFFRAAGQHTSGSGLGLSIAARVARLHGLGLTLANRPDGGFCATLRRVDADLQDGPPRGLQL